MAKKNQLVKAKVKDAQLDKVKAKDEYLFKVKGKKDQPPMLLPIEGQSKAFEVGSTVKAQLSQVSVPKGQSAIIDIFQGVLAKTGHNPTNLELGIKAGYHSTMFGLTKARYGNVWRGLATFTDNQLCFHAYDHLGLTFDKITKIRQDNGLNVNRAGKGWVTVTFHKDNVVKATKMVLDVVKAVSGK